VISAADTTTSGLSGHISDPEDSSNSILLADVASLTAAGPHLLRVDGANSDAQSLATHGVMASSCPSLRWTSGFDLASDVQRPNLLHAFGSLGTTTSAAYDASQPESGACTSPSPPTASADSVSCVLIRPRALTMR
jgi:hypothetical protein